jgi:hypothetical protein
MIDTFLAFLERLIKPSIVNSFLAIVDRLIKLSERREIADDQLFDRFVEPLYRDFEVVAADYIGFFRSCVDELDSATPTAREAEWFAVVTRVRKRREEVLLTRRKVQQLARAASEFENDDVTFFAQDILSFFHGTEIPIGIEQPDDVRDTFTSKIAELFELLAGQRILEDYFDEYVAGAPLSRTYVRVLLESTIVRLERRCSDVMQSYAKLLVRRTVK